VLDTVNSLLLPSSSSGYATLDATIVDTLTGQVDFIKIGSSISIIKGQEESEMIGVESLPLGVAVGVTPSACTRVLEKGDVVVLVSDGIADLFASSAEFCNFVNNERIINMQLFAESILEEAQARLTDKKDDMTVIAYRLVQKR
jgi:stage II sporulation protein E